MNLCLSTSATDVLEIRARSFTISTQVLGYTISEVDGSALQQDGVNVDCPPDGGCNLWLKDGSGIAHLALGSGSWLGVDETRWLQLVVQKHLSAGQDRHQKKSDGLEGVLYSMLVSRLSMVLPLAILVTLGLLYIFYEERPGIEAFLQNLAALNHREW